MAHKVWIIADAARGPGYALAQAALGRGDWVVAASEALDVLQPLIDEYGGSVATLSLDGSDRKAVFDTIRSAHAYFGRLDVVVAITDDLEPDAAEEEIDLGLRGPIEPCTAGSHWVIQAALPFLREPRGGHILTFSDKNGVEASPLPGRHGAYKEAVRTFVDAVAREVDNAGVHITHLKTEPSDSREPRGTGHPPAHREEHPHVSPGEVAATGQSAFRNVDSYSPR